MSDRLIVPVLMFAFIIGGCVRSCDSGSHGRPISIRLSDTVKPATQPAVVYQQWPFDSQEAVRRQAETAKALGIPSELSIIIDDKIAITLALIPAGRFVMGSPQSEGERFESEGPQHEVVITKPFYMATCDVTQEQYEHIMGKNPSHYKGAINPVDNVTWNDAMEFCDHISRVTGAAAGLPTEAQWEYACRAGTSTPFYTGPTISPEDANYDGSYSYADGPKGVFRKTTIPVGSFKSNAFGLYDMAGNVGQWCSDWYADRYKSASPQVDAVGPATGEYRVARGSSWEDHPWGCRSANRGRDWPTRADGGCGFRVVIALPDAPAAATSVKSSATNSTK